MTSQTDPSAPGQGPSRKDRRAAERSARKSGSRAPSTSQSSGRSMWLITGAAIAIALLAIMGLVVVSGGFDAERIRRFEEAGVPADAYGVGSSLLRGNTDFTADVVLVEGRPCAKAGRRLDPNPRLERVT